MSASHTPISVELTPSEVASMSTAWLRWIDVRDAEERAAEGWIDGSICSHVDELDIDDGDARIIMLVCASGRRSLERAEQLRASGHARVVSLAGGMEAWAAQGRPIVGRASERYVRQVALPQVGAAGQAALGAARVLVIGAGGLGSPAITYLAVAGVGTLGIVDDDVVERSNLHRQPLHLDGDVGSRKTSSAARAIREHNPDVTVIEHACRLTADNADELLADGWDVVLDCTDDLHARLALNDAALRCGVPVVHGSVDRFEGRVAVLGGDGPCLRCMHPNVDRAQPRSCSDGGVLGVVPGMIGVLQATETLKLLLGLPSPLRRGVLVVDLLSMQFHAVPIARSASCPACGS